MNWAMHCTNATERSLGRVRRRARATATLRRMHTELTSAAGYATSHPRPGRVPYGQSNASALVDPRDNVYELRRLAVATRAQGDAMHDQARELERAAWELDRALRRSRPTR
jgi:hypothetical protein